jgi:hypothetical protein
LARPEGGIICVYSIEEVNINKEEKREKKITHVVVKRYPHLTPT